MIKSIERNIRINYYSEEYDCDLKCTAEVSHDETPGMSLSVRYAEDEDPSEYILCSKHGYFWLIDPFDEILIRLMMPYGKDDLIGALEDLGMEEERTECLAAALSLVISNEELRRKPEISSSYCKEYHCPAENEDIPF